MMIRKWWWLLLFTSLAHGEVPRPAQFELGLSAGTPALVNLNLGFWGTESVPLLARVYGGYWGYGLGYGGELGWLFDNAGAFRQYLAAGAEAGGGISPFTLDTGTISSVGLHYGFNWKGFFLDVGLGYGETQRSEILIFNYRVSRGLMPSIQIGYAFFFDL
jgi:hypothetical protein